MWRLFFVGVFIVEKNGGDDLFLSGHGGGWTRPLPENLDIGCNNQV